MNRWVISENVGHAGGGTYFVNPFIHIVNRAQGFAITNNSYEGVDAGSAYPLIYLGTRQNGHFIAGNGFERVLNGIAIEAADLGSSTVIHQGAAYSDRGNVRINGIDYGASNYQNWDSENNHILISGRYNNLV